MTEKRWQSLTEMFFSQAEREADTPFLFEKIDGTWQSWSWRETALKVARLAAGLKRLGIEKGDRVALVSENRREWFVADLAIMAAGAVSVPTYTTYTARDYVHIFENSAARATIVSTKILAKKVLSAAYEVDHMQDIIVMEDFKLGQFIKCNIHLFDQVVEQSEPDMDALKKTAKALTRDDLACLIYTSGTGGSPKGVKLHHGAILHNCEGARDVVKPLGLKDNRFLSFLPLSHAYEHTAGQFFPVIIGAQIWYAENIEKLAANIEETSPTIMVVVPRLFEMLRTKLLRRVASEGGMKAKLFQYTLEIGTKKLKGQPLGILEKLIDPLLNIGVRRKVQKRFGGRLKALVSGGAPLSPDVGYFFTALGLPLLQGYGQTEAGPIISVNPPHLPKMHTVGKVLKGVTVKIAKDGEILVSGELVMKGYWCNQEVTAATLVDGWLHTGDVGHFDQDGYLEITDRKKDIIVNDKGDNISPQKVEGLLCLEEEVAQAMVYGDNHPYLVGLIVPDKFWLASWSKENGKSDCLTDLWEDEDLHNALSLAVARVNQRLSNVEKVRRFILAREAFSIENELMTPTLKIRRHAVKKVYGPVLEGLFRAGKESL